MDSTSIFHSSTSPPFLYRRVLLNSSLLLRPLGLSIALRVQTRISFGTQLNLLLLSNLRDGKANMLLIFFRRQLQVVLLSASPQHLNLRLRLHSAQAIVILTLSNIQDLNLMYSKSARLTLYSKFPLLSKYSDHHRGKLVLQLSKHSSYLWLWACGGHQLYYEKA